MKVLVTGASGFIGGELVRFLGGQKHEVLSCARSRLVSSDAVVVTSPCLGSDSDWLPLLRGIEAVIHLAGLSDTEQRGSSAEAEFTRVNVDGTRNLAAQCAKAGVKHFVFMSSAHAVAGESEERLLAGTLPRPNSPYARSKLAAESALIDTLSPTCCAWTILRPTAVYGPGGNSNFAKLLRLVRSGIPLPFGAVRNRRSFIYVGNLVRLIEKCVGQARAFGKIYYPSDRQDVSTPELIRKIALAATARRDATNHRGEARSPVFPFPLPALKLLASLPAMAPLRKMISSLYVDSEPLCRDLEWTPPFRMDEGLRRTLSRG